MIINLFITALVIALVNSEPPPLPPYATNHIADNDGFSDGPPPNYQYSYNGQQIQSENFHKIRLQPMKSSIFEWIGSRISKLPKFIPRFPKFAPVTIAKGKLPSYHALVMPSPWKNAQAAVQISHTDYANPSTSVINTGYAPQQSSLNFVSYNNPQTYQPQTLPSSQYVVSQVPTQVAFDSYKPTVAAIQTNNVPVVPFSNGPDYFNTAYQQQQQQPTYNVQQQQETSYSAPQQQQNIYNVPQQQQNIYSAPQQQQQQDAYTVSQQSNINNNNADYASYFANNNFQQDAKSSNNYNIYSPPTHYQKQQPQHQQLQAQSNNNNPNYQTINYQISNQGDWKPIMDTTGSASEYQTYSDVNMSPPVQSYSTLPEKAQKPQHHPVYSLPPLPQSKTGELDQSYASSENVESSLKASDQHAVDNLPGSGSFELISKAKDISSPEFEVISSEDGQLIDWKKIVQMIEPGAVIDEPQSSASASENKEVKTTASGKNGIANPQKGLLSYLVNSSKNKLFTSGISTTQATPSFLISTKTPQTLSSYIRTHSLNDVMKFFQNGKILVKKPQYETNDNQKDNQNADSSSFIDVYNDRENTTPETTTYHPSTKFPLKTFNLVNEIPLTVDSFTSRKQIKNNKENVEYDDINDENSNTNTGADNFSSSSIDNNDDGGVLKLKLSDSDFLTGSFYDRKTPISHHFLNHTERENNHPISQEDSISYENINFANHPDFFSKNGFSKDIENKHPSHNYQFAVPASLNGYHSANIEYHLTNNNNNYGQNNSSTFPKINSLFDSIVNYENLFESNEDDESNGDLSSQASVQNFRIVVTPPPHLKAKMAEMTTQRAKKAIEIKTMSPDKLIFHANSTSMLYKIPMKLESKEDTNTNEKKVKPAPVYKRKPKAT